MALTRPQFLAIESVQEFDDLLRGAVMRALAQEDQFGYLRLDLLIAQGVTFSTGPSSGAPKDDAPTFERVMGRPPVSPHDPFGLPMALAYLAESAPGSLPWATPDATEPKLSELEQEEVAARLALSRRLLAEAQMKAQMARSGRPMQPPEEEASSPMK